MAKISNPSDDKLQQAVWKSPETNVDFNPNYEAPAAENVGEFPEAVQELIDRARNANLDRKKFLTLMGASLSMASLNCLKEPAEKIVPYVSRPPEMTPGIAKYYATNWATADEVIPMLVKTREGKPIKVEGHAAHPITKEAMSANGHAAIFDLYDPDRLKSPMKREGDGFAAASWDAALKQASAAIKKKKVRVLSRASFSPSEKAVVAKFLKGSGRSQVVYDPIGDIQEVIAGDAASYGTAIVPDYRFDKAKLIVSIGADFLGSWLSPATFTKRYTAGRTPEKGMSRLVVAEANMSLTGSNADTRLPINSGTHATFALGLANAVARGTRYASALSAYTPTRAAAVTGVTAEVINSLAAELLKKKGKSLVVGGGASARNGKLGSVQVAVNLINTILGNDGKTIQTSAAMKGDNDLSSPAAIEKLVKDMSSGKVDTLIVDRCNPVFELPQHLAFAAALKKVKNVIVIGQYLDDTAAHAHLVLSSAHFLEGWSDSHSYGIYGIGQPTIRPLFDTRSAGDIWLDLAGEKESFYSYLKKNGKGNFATTLSRGYSVIKKQSGSASRKFRTGAISKAKGPLKATSGYQLTLYSNVAVKDGAGGNNAYRQELPDPVSKVTWGNYVAISPATAKAEDWQMGDIVSVTAAGQKVEAPVFIQPGLADKTVAMAIGYGRGDGAVGKGVGVNVAALAQLKKGAYRTDGIAVTLKATGDFEQVSTTQTHHDMHGRALSRSTNLKSFLANPEAGHEGVHKLPGKGLYEPHKYDGYRWGMNIDLNKCTGCSACVVSCYSENNIPVVGKDQVDVGREMSWMRIDRYYKGDLSNPEVVFQPVLCQHCENAPCENVCPVAATTHNSEGLNDMTYNRCIGTRYCANNCPYKVRRFNYFENWEGKLRDPQQLSLNPDVTVRSRGVIEKCSFCIQRINAARQEATLAGRKIEEGDFKTACQQGCPADAIEFGNINNKESEVAKAETDSRSYKILANVNVKPMVSYRVKVNNQS